VQFFWPTMYVLAHNDHSGAAATLSKQTISPAALPATAATTTVILQGKCSSCYAPAPVGEAGALGGHRRPSSVRPSVCLSDVAYIGSNSKTKRPRKTKLCTGVPQVTCDSQTDFKVKRSKVKVTGSISAAQRHVPIFRKRIKLRPSNLVRT